MNCVEDGDDDDEEEEKTDLAWMGPTRSGWEALSFLFVHLFPHSGTGQLGPITVYQHLSIASSSISQFITQIILHSYLG